VDSIESYLHDARQGGTIIMLVEMTLLLLASAVLIFASALSRQLAWQRKQLDKSHLGGQSHYGDQPRVDKRKATARPKIIAAAVNPPKTFQKARRRG
jgi:hypothetical protein